MPIDQYTFDRAIADNLQYGDIAAIAKAEGKTPGYFSQLFSPEEPEKRLLWKAANIFSDWIDKNPSGGRVALKMFNTVIEARRRHEFKVEHTTGKMAIEVGQSVDAEFKQESWHKRYKEATEALTAAENHVLGGSFNANRAVTVDCSGEISVNKFYIHRMLDTVTVSN